MGYSIRQAIALSLFVLFLPARFSSAREYQPAGRLSPADRPVTEPRTPLGVYAKVDIEQAIKGFTDPSHAEPAGGAEFDHPVTGSANFLEQGCPDYPDVSKCTDLTIEQAAFNVLRVFFHGTPAADFDPGEVTSRIQYLEVPYVDVEYANKHPCETNPVANLGSVSLENLLYRASKDLFEMADWRPPPPLPAKCF